MNLCEKVAAAIPPEALEVVRTVYEDPSIEEALRNGPNRFKTDDIVVFVRHCEEHHHHFDIFPRHLFLKRATKAGITFDDPIIVRLQHSALEANRLSGGSADYAAWILIGHNSHMLVSIVEFFPAGIGQA